MKKKALIAAALLAVITAVLCFTLLRPGTQPAGAQIFLDGEPVSGPALFPEKQDGLRVILTLDGQEIANLPFGEAHTVRVLQENGDENTLVLTEESVYMESANCEGQDCVHMEEITRDNLETRVMFGMIICLPHRLSAEVRQ